LVKEQRGTDDRAGRRAYHMRRRAERIEATRQRIVEATMGLHETIGPARTTITGVAERAGVQRLTVYRHFPSEAALLAACQRHWLEAHPYPDLSDLRADDPWQRLREALDLLYARHRATCEMTANVLRDAQTLPALAELVGHVGQRLTGLAAELASAVAPRARGRDRLRVVAAVRHVLDFATWRSLTDAGLTDPEAIDLALALVAAATGMKTAARASSSQ
jgi:AcrR family transcriptional regulator